jgi:chitinase
MRSSGEQLRLSLGRLLILVALVAVIAGGSYALYERSVSTSSAESVRADVWFVPYVDTTLTPTLHFEEPLDQPTPDVALAFIVADRSNGCEPSWGAYYNLDAAGRALDLDRRLIRLRDRGGSAVVSFGGAINQELAIACTDADALLSAYKTVVERYKPVAIDFDIEGAALANTAANARRAAALGQLQTANKDLEVWFTLPVDPQGLSADALKLVEQALAAGVKLRGVNVMTMDYGASRGQMSMRDATQAALNRTWEQLDRAYRAGGLTLNSREVWNRIGVTPMIGQNDEPSEVFSLEDARWLVDFAAEKHIGRISSWSVNRDVSCGGANDGRVSNTCSGIAQAPFEFASILGSAGTPARAVKAGDDTTVKAPPAGRISGMSVDDPMGAPYPIWRTARAYEAGVRVVWQDRVYIAKWWTQGDQPDAPVKNAWDSPWRYLGPVTEADRQAVRAVLATPSSTRRMWERERIYLVGDEVEYFGRAYRAKWWTQGDQPVVDPDWAYSYPWEYLGDIIKSPPSVRESTLPATPTPEPELVAPVEVSLPEPEPTPAPTATPTAVPPTPRPTSTSSPSLQRIRPAGEPTPSQFPRRY